MNHEHMSHMLPDFIHGTLQPEDHALVEHAIAHSNDLEQEYHALKRVFDTLRKEDILLMMNENAASVGVLFPLKKTKNLLIPKILIGTSTSIAACVLLWIGISQKTIDTPQQKLPTNSSAVQLADIMDENSTLDLQSDEVEEVILDDILSVYVSDIESGTDINPLLEQEITTFLLQENLDDEAL